MESHIRYIKVVGGPVDHEVLLVGLKNGQVYIICCSIHSQPIGNCGDILCAYI